MNLSFRCPKCFSALDVAVYMGHCMNRQCDYVFGTDTIIPQRGIPIDTRSLKIEKKDFMHSSVAGRTAKKEFFLDDSDLEKIGAVKRYGLIRYMKEDIVKYVNGEK